MRRYDSAWHRADPEASIREFKVLDELERRSFPAPRPMLLDQQGGPFGAPTVVKTRLPGRPVLREPDLEDYVRLMAITLPRPNCTVGQLTAWTFCPTGSSRCPASLSKRKSEYDALEPGLRQAVLAEWPSVSVAPTRRTLAAAFLRHYEAAAGHRVRKLPF